jgi:hypothetical protein
MEFTTLTCPRCQTRMTAVRTASPRLVCPRCLSVVENPASHEPPPPVPVLPLGTQCHRDSRNAGYIVLFLALAIPLGIALAIAKSNQFDGSLIFVFVIVLTVGWSLVALVKGSRKDQMAARLTAVPLLPTDISASTVRVLNYARPRPVRTSSYSQKTNIGAAIGGFFLGLGVCIAGTALLVATMGRERTLLYPLLVLGAVLGVAMAGGTLVSKPGFKGFQPAVVIGLVIGMLALGPIGLCYFVVLH